MNVFVGARLFPRALSHAGSEQVDVVVREHEVGLCGGNGPPGESLGLALCLIGGLRCDGYLNLPIVCAAFCRKPTKRLGLGMRT